MARKRRRRSRRKNKNKKQVGGWQGRGLLIMGLMTAVVFLPTTMILVIGMLPTPAAILVDKSKRKIKVVSVGAMNLAACMPFILELWSLEHTFARSFEILTDPMSILIMYAGAAVGYIIDWSLTNVISVFLYERGKTRMVAIRKAQKDLLDRWGPEVKADSPLGADGFFIEGEKNKTAEGAAQHKEGEENKAAASNAPAKAAS